MLYIMSLVLTYLTTGSLYLLTTFVTMQRYYIMIDNIPHTVHIIPMTHLCCNWTVVPLNLPYLFSPLPPFQQPPLHSLYL